MTSMPNLVSPGATTPSAATPGTRYGRYTVLSAAQSARKSRVFCRCDCGTEKDVRLDSLKSGMTLSCGCFKTEQRKSEKPHLRSTFADVLHKRFGRLLATGLQREVGKETRIVCLCDCGAQIVTRAQRLLNGSSTSCGCYHKERRVEQGAATRDHGHTVDGELACGKTSIYRAWLKMRQLCLGVQRRGLGRVSGEYDPQWATFAGFLADFGEIGFTETIRRKDRTLPWSKANCYVCLGPMDSRRKTRAENARSAEVGMTVTP